MKMKISEEVAEDIKQGFNQNLIDEISISWMEVQSYIDRGEPLHPNQRKDFDGASNCFI